MQWFSALIDPDRDVSVLDVGGTPSYWRAFPQFYRNPRIRITVVNLDPQPFDDENISVRPGDACNLSEYSDNSFDVVHSNSVIEHVGDMTAMQRMAAEIRRLAPAYFVQTPNYWFPIEPHFKLPFVHWLPERARFNALVALGKARRSQGLDAVRRIRLIGESTLAGLFPDANIAREKVAGLTKSLVAVRSR